MKDCLNFALTGSFVIDPSLKDAFFAKVTSHFMLQIEIRGNGIYDNENYGISCQNEAVIFENDLMGNRGTEIQLKSNKSVQVKQIRVPTKRCTVNLLIFAIMVLIT